MTRFGSLSHAWLVALDQLAYVTLAGPAYLITGGQAPSPYETISSAVGRHADEGHRWALLAQPVIDGLAEMLGAAPGHCQRSIVRAEVIDASLPASLNPTARDGGEVRSEA